MLDTRQKTIFALKIAAPYLAVLIGLYIFHNAWLSIFLYHGQILLWWFLRNRANIQNTANNQTRNLTQNTIQHDLPKHVKQLLDIAAKGMLPISALAGVACYFLLPYMVREVGGLELWLNSKQLTGLALVLLIPYFGIFHPPLEQVHWQPLTKLPRPYNYISHLSFAIYHGLVLYPILQNIWVILCLIILSCISFLWSYVRKQKNRRYLAILSHVLADLGIVTAAYLHTL